ncbi:MAG: tRNA (N6-isopentenyl adenosine(37)-C2)-methylthiotransferase MiaB [Ruminococcaceae bacterium]|nr:tRNA (N6-isopentenyl adenosine(37)-C2)-methylthiotransferase MiaB [Oscillospiraceae bacterium]
MSKSEINRISREQTADALALLDRLKAEYGGGKAFVETYGCQQNVSDSEALSGMLARAGFTPCDSADEADIILFNTCAVRENAENRVFGNIGALKHLKARRPEVIIGVCGCMIQQEHIAKKIRSTYRHVELVFGTHALARFPYLLSEALSRRGAVMDVADSAGVIAEGLPYLRADGVGASVSIMYGCNNFCTYCIVPYVRGRERSRAPEDVIAEVKALAAQGYREVMLLGQNVNSYGKDLGNTDFATLLSQVAQVEGIARVRFMTPHPKDISIKVLDTMAAHDNICKQLHLPLQAGNNRVLKAMNRVYTREDYLKIVQAARERMPEITITTDIIVGFPGETNEEFADTLDMLEQVRYDTIFSFIYSKRQGTKAATMPDVLTDEEKKRNFDALLAVQNRISKEINDTYVGKTLTVLTEGVSKTDEAVLTGRTEGGKIVNFTGNPDCIGNLTRVTITESRTWSLVGEQVN